MKNSTKIILKVILVFLLLWIIIALMVETEGPYRKTEIGRQTSTNKVLIVYDPDPFYNLDQQLCESLGNVLANNNFNVTIASVAAVNQLNTDVYSSQPPMPVSVTLTTSATSPLTSNLANVPGGIS